jgi:hypothetical protein
MPTTSTTALAGARFGRIPAAEARSGLKRGSLYGLAAQHPGLFRKYGAATVVDLEFLDRVLAELPPADIGAGSSSTDEAA